MRTVVLSSLFLFFFFQINAQDEIFLKNPSFEDSPKLSHTPTDWFDCGFSGESPVDIHPVPNSDYQVTKTAIDGDTYLGMIVRDNETWEAVGQRLSQPLKAGKAYSFSMHLARSATYLSKMKKTQAAKETSKKNGKINSATPIKLRIWGGNDYCKKGELLAESSLIINTRWLDFNFQFEPNIDVDYITFEAFYKTPSPYPYNGNILLDNASSIVEIVDGFVTKRSPRRTVKIDKDTSSAQPINPPSNKQKTYIKPPINKVSKIPLSERKKVLPVKKAPKERILPIIELDSQGKNNFSSLNLIEFYKEYISLVEFPDNSAKLDEISIQALSLIAERLTTIDKDLKIIIQAKAPNASLKKERLNAIKSTLSKAKLSEAQYTFGFETNTPVLLNESNSSIRMKLCLR